MTKKKWWLIVLTLAAALCLGSHAEPAWAYWASDTGVWTIESESDLRDDGVLKANVKKLIIKAKLDELGPTFMKECKNLESVTIEEGGSVDRIGSYAFQNCENLKTVNLPTVKSIDFGTFSSCTNLESVTLPDVESIVSELFSGCTNLKNVALTNVKSIGYAAFKGCTSLTTVPLSGDVELGADVFADCTGLQSLDLSQLTTIGEGMFSMCTGLTSVTLPKNGEIGNRAFDGCKGLTEINLSQVDEIGTYAFIGCSGLTSVTLGDQTALPAGVFTGCTDLATIDLSKVTDIGASAFSGCSRLSSVTLNENLKKLGGGAFAGTSLTTVKIPAGITTLETSIFEGCTSMKTVELPTALTTIGGTAFYGCKNLKTLQLPDSVTTIGYQAFMNSGLTSIELPASVGERAFSGCADLSTVELSDNLKTIEAGTFSGCTALQSLTLPNALETIGSQAFQNSGLTSITLPANVTSVGEGAFSGCTALQSLSYPQHIQLEVSELTGAGITPDQLKPVEDADGHEWAASWSWTEDHSSATATLICKKDRMKDHSSTTATDAAPEVSTTATCTAAGKTTYTASVTFSDINRTFTGSEEVDQAALGHDYGNWTSNNDGTHSGSCQRTGCTATDTQDCTYVDGVCSVCGYSEPEDPSIDPEDPDNPNDPSTDPGDEPSRPAEPSVPSAPEIDVTEPEHGTVEIDEESPQAGDTVTITPQPEEGYEVDEVIVTDEDGNRIPVTENPDGSWSYEQPDGDVTITVTFTEPEPEPSTDVSEIFLDVAPNAWYKDAVQYAYDNGLMTGVSATEFAPDQTTTRAMIVSILARLEGVTSASDAGFSDVDDEWFATAVNWAASENIVAGFEDNTFRPNAAITREQLAAILMNYAAYKGEDVSARADLSAYSDADAVSSWAAETMSWAVAEGYISGMTADELQPQGNATRAQLAAILERYLSI